MPWPITEAFSRAAFTAAASPSRRWTYTAATARTSIAIRLVAMNRKIARDTDGGSTEPRAATDSALLERGRRTVNAPGTGCATGDLKLGSLGGDRRTGVRPNRYQCPHCYRYLHHAT